MRRFRKQGIYPNVSRILQFGDARGVGRKKEEGGQATGN
jgi:hypothetical protein